MTLRCPFRMYRYSVESGIPVARLISCGEKSLVKDTLSPETYVVEGQRFDPCGHYSKEFFIRSTILTSGNGDFAFQNEVFRLGCGGAGVVMRKNSLGTLYATFSPKASLTILTT